MKNIFLEEGKDLAVFNKIRKRSKAYKQIIEVFGRRAGNYRQTKMRVGDRYGIMNGCPYHRSIPKAMRKLEEKFANLDNPSREDILELHYEFETIHPFVDGNGRTGRLVMNWLSLQHLGEFIVVDNDVKQDYYAILQKYKPKFKRDNPNVRFYKDQDNTGKFEMEVYRMMQEQDERLNNKK